VYDEAGADLLRKNPDHAGDGAWRRGRTQGSSYAALCKDGRIPWPQSRSARTREQVSPRILVSQQLTLRRLTRRPSLNRRALQLRIDLKGLAEVECKTGCPDIVNSGFWTQSTRWGWHTLSRRARSDFPLLSFAVLTRGSRFPLAGTTGESGVPPLSAI